MRRWHGPGLCGVMLAERDTALPSMLGERHAALVFRLAMRGDVAQNGGAAGADTSARGGLRTRDRSTAGSGDRPVRANWPREVAGGLRCGPHGEK
mmetsp:Transcript_155983/g.271385  ORF Transcript_155983/g.271385 Transcript_155983/m.271385 type:complete len:95 (-) Transcript_155983:1081-1365(-)